MADSKITALTSISTSTDPANDPLVIVDVSDTSMAASGTAKKVTLNQLLGASGTATLASATITGAATVGSDLTLNGNENYVYLFSNYSIGNNSRVRFRAVGAGGGSGYGGDFRVSTRASNNTWNTDVLTIDSSANCIWTDGAGGTRMTLNATGLGVGLAPANDKLLVSQTIGLVTSTTADVNFRNIGNTTIQRIRYDDSTGTLTIGSALGTAYPVQIGGNTTTRAVTIDASGNLLVGTTAVGMTAGGVRIKNASGTVGEIALSNNSGSADYVARFFWGSTPTLVGNITVASGGTTYNTTSDYRLKKDVHPLVGGLARVSALKPSVYNWKTDGSAGEGFLAHELAEVVPFAVIGEKDAVNEDGSIKPQGVDMSRVVPILVAAIQELTARVQTLETR